jgi:hypothetical protein
LLGSANANSVLGQGISSAAGALGRVNWSNLFNPSSTGMNIWNGSNSLTNSVYDPEVIPG